MKKDLQPWSNEASEFSGASHVSDICCVSVTYGCGFLNGSPCCTLHVKSEMGVWASFLFVWKCYCVS